MPKNLCDPPSFTIKLFTIDDTNDFFQKKILPPI